MTTLLALADKVQTEADAYRYLEGLRWPGGVVCPNCHGSDVYLIQPKNGVSRKATNGTMSQRRTWNCRECRRAGRSPQFSATSGTVMHATKAPVRLWILVIFDMMTAKNGISAREVSRKYGVCPRTAWFICHRIRETMSSDALITTMRGTIVADETWIGGNPRNRHANRPKSAAHTDKTPVLALINAETGEARSRVIPNVQSHTLSKFIGQQVDVAGSHLQTDEGSWYKPVGRWFASHETVNHNDGVYVRGSVTTNRAEGYFAQLKRSLDGTFHHVSEEHLQRYVDEFDFRYSTCKISDTQRMAESVRRGDGKRVTYKRVKTKA